MKNLSLEDKWAVLVLLVAAVLRFYNYADWSMSNDELSALTRLQFDSFGEMIQKGVRDNDMHPMGVQSFLWVWTHWFGLNETAVRLPFVVLGIGSVWLFYLTGRNFFGKSSALAAMAVFAALQFPILYSQLARPYSPGLFFSLLTAYAWSNIVWVNKEWRWRDGILFILGAVGCMYSHYFSFMFAGFVGLAGLIYLRGADLRKYLLCGVLMFLAYIPNVDVFIAQFSIGGLGGPEGWLGPPGKDALWKYVLYGLNDSLWLLLVLVGVALLFGRLYPKQDGLRSKRVMAFLFFILPALVAYFYSILKNPVFQYSILLFSFPFLLLWLFSWFQPAQWKMRETGIVVALLVLVSFSTVVAERFYSTQFFAPFKDVAEKCGAYQEKYKSKGTVVTVNVINKNYIHYYSERIQPSLNFSQYICNQTAHYVELKKIVDTSSARVFIHGWSNNYHAPETELIIAEKFPFLIERDTFFNAGVMVYSKDSTLGRIAEPVPVYSFRNDFEKEPWGNDSLNKSSAESFSGEYSLPMTDAKEFSPAIESRAENAGVEKGATFLFTCKYLSAASLAEMKLVVEVKRGEEIVLWRGYALNSFPAVNGEWTSFYAGYSFQEDIQPDDVMKAYIYNPNKEKAFIDDVDFRILPALKK